MEFVVEDPQRRDGITTYQPAECEYDQTTDTWTLLLSADGGGQVQRWIPRERIVYIEGDPSHDITDR